ncbi:MAG: hypothetical protein GY726_16090 [Proteobacteria bacterium]|nr:hypothetical protein [Pseudomonadota bacterium]
MQNDKGETLHFRAIEITDGKITIDANHPLVRKPTAEELKDQPSFTVQ